MGREGPLRPESLQQDNEVDCSSGGYQINLRGWIPSVKTDPGLRADHPDF